MIVVKLIGGLGNQMFQYAYGLRLAEEYQEDICLDTSFYPKGTEPALYKLCVPELPLWQDVGISRGTRMWVSLVQRWFRATQKLIRILGKTDRTGDRLYGKLAKRGLLFNFDPYYYPIPKTDKPNKYVYGYFQGTAYFPKNTERLKTDFCVRQELSPQAQAYMEQILQHNAVALHIRLGDYKEKKNMDLDVCSVSYYRASLERIRQLQSNHKLFVFTNEPDKIGELLDLPEGTVVVRGTKDYEDFSLMQKCRHFVLSNSTFSWWAAYLAENPDKLLFVPEKWRHSEKDEPAIYTENMVKIPIC